MIWRDAGPYFTCQRSQQKWPISDMSWDNGLLVANPEKDVAINGSFEFRMAREASRDRQELVPEPKLIHPIDPFNQLSTLPASAGSY